MQAAAGCFCALNPCPFPCSFAVFLAILMATRSLTPKLPWLSLSLLFIAYTSFSWFVAHSAIPWLAWGLAISFTMLQALLFTTMFARLRLFARLWLRSDLGYFTLILAGAISVTFALVWFRVFGYCLVIVSAEILARLDLQNMMRCNRMQALLILTIVSFSGLLLGWLMSLNPLFRLG